MIRFLNFLIFTIVLALIIYGGIFISKNTGTADTGTKIYFFYRGNLHPVSRDFGQISEQELLSKALSDLWAGPNEKEKKQGIISLIPKDINIQELALTDGILKIKLNKLFLNLSGNAQIEGILKQIVFTMTQFSGIQAVDFNVEGNRGGTLIIGGEGYTINRPLNREYFK